ncbi:hypothetical protein [Ruegeria atlantica]|uniref:hypothetical protein n=1 Tax=Ruegeria atlantica TaxID=81569 RepID=UPI001479EA6D|nr:hypothetical protein [Ruegeria atlantica]
MDDWAIKAYGITTEQISGPSRLFTTAAETSAREHVFSLLHLTREEGEFYKTGFAVLHKGTLANWLLFQWWTHSDVWCQLLSYSDLSTPESFTFSTRPVRACVHETAVIWFEQKSWIKNVLSGNADRRAYLADLMPPQMC